jgi:hypothetical protein
MYFADQIQQLSKRLSEQSENLATEEATKNAAVMPLLNLLGYNVFDPTVVVPEFTADTGTKKGEKVDYAIMRDGTPVMLIECKSVGSKLSSNHTGQLFRYFSVTEARFAILTNGIEYRFYTDIEKTNKMDERPFFEFDLLEYDQKDLNELKKFSSANFDLDDILSNASELKYKRQIKLLIGKEFSEPSEDFIRHFTSKVYEGRFTPQVKERFQGLVNDACRDFIKDMINARLESALLSNSAVEGLGSDNESESTSDEVENIAKELGIITTAEEMEAYHIVRAILSKHLQPSRIAIRDTKSYCGVLLDDNNRKPLCRFHFNTANKYISLFDNDKQEEKISIKEPVEIYQYEERLILTLNIYN